MPLLFNRPSNAAPLFTQEKIHYIGAHSMLIPHSESPCVAALPGSLHSSLTILQLQQRETQSENFPLRYAVPSIRYKVKPKEQFIATSGTWSSNLLLCGSTEGDIYSFNASPANLQSSTRMFPLLNNDNTQQEPQYTMKFLK